MSLPRHHLALLPITPAAAEAGSAGRGAFLFDHRGQPYLDLCNNPAGLGHSHPKARVLLRPHARRASALSAPSERLRALRD